MQTLESQLKPLKKTLIKFRSEYFCDRLSEQISITQVLDYSAKVLGGRNWGIFSKNKIYLGHGSYFSKVLKISRTLYPEEMRRIFLTCTDLPIFELGKCPPNMHIDEICRIIDENIEYTSEVYLKRYLKGDFESRKIRIKDARKIVKYLFTSNFFKKHFERFIYTPKAFKEKNNLKNKRIGKLRKVHSLTDSFELIPNLTFLEQYNSFNDESLVLALDLAYHCFIKDWKVKSKKSEYYHDPYETRLGIYAEASTLLIALLNKTKANCEYFAYNIFNQKSIHKPTRFSELVFKSNNALLKSELERVLLDLHDNLHIELPQQKLYVRRPRERTFTGELLTSNRFSTNENLVNLVKHLSNFAVNHNYSFELRVYPFTFTKSSQKKLRDIQNLYWVQHYSHDFYLDLLINTDVPIDNRYCSDKGFQQGKFRHFDRCRVYPI